MTIIIALVCQKSAQTARGLVPIGVIPVCAHRDTEGAK
jgi:hypothetical protein